MAAQQATKKRSPAMIIVAVGLMLFSMFFGAGNLVFPPMLGVHTGEHFTPAIIGFLITGVALPIITVIAVAVSGTGVRDLAGRAGALFGLIFAITIYMSIGSLYAIPRAGAIAYELGIESTLGLEGGLWRLIGTGIFFLCCTLIALNPGKVVDTLGNILTPVLLVLIGIMIVRSMMILDGAPLEAAEKYQRAPLFAGIIEGYFTMDAIAALAFAIIVVSSFKTVGITQHRTVISYTAIAGVIAGFFLMVVYLGLGLMGTVMPDKEAYTDGANLLSEASRIALGTTGDAVFSGVVILACLTTVVGLLAAMSSFFIDLIPAISYRKWVVIFAALGFIIANLGLERILSIAGPIIGLIYPPAIALIGVTLLNLALPKYTLPLTYRTAVYTALVFSAIQLVLDMGVELGPISSLLGFIPLFDAGVGWLVPSLVFGAIALIFDLRNGEERKEALVGGEISDDMVLGPPETQ